MLQPSPFVKELAMDKIMFQTPSAGRWVLQLNDNRNIIVIASSSFKPHQRGGGC